MKSNLLVCTVLLLSAVAVHAAGGRGRPAAAGTGTGSGAGVCLPSACPASTCILNPATDSGPLTLAPAAQQAVLFQIDEERMARELYAAFEAKWGLRPFAHIQRSEATHEEALRLLATRASLALPAATAGIFANAEVQQRYSQILELGLSSATAALRAGALTEETDIADLRTLAAATDDATLQSAIAALERASRNHLRAFVRNLQAQGITYEPRVLSAADFQAIIAAPTGRGPRS